jgi:hypothetical protein
MISYTILVDPDYASKFENFLSNLNKTNSRFAVTVLKKEEIVAVPKEESDGNGRK